VLRNQPDIANDAAGELVAFSAREVQRWRRRAWPDHGSDGLFHAKRADRSVPRRSSFRLALHRRCR
jgi:hypothetical protein